MISEEILNKPIMMMTGKEFLELHNVVLNQEPGRLQQNNKEYVYGLDGLASILGCGKTKAQQIKNSRVLDDAIIQNGKTLIIDKEKALELLRENA